MVGGPIFHHTGGSYRAERLQKLLVRTHGLIACSQNKEPETNQAKLKIQKQTSKRQVRSLKAKSLTSFFFEFPKQAGVGRRLFPNDPDSSLLVYKKPLLPLKHNNLNKCMPTSSFGL